MDRIEGTSVYISAVETSPTQCWPGQTEHCDDSSFLLQDVSVIVVLAGTRVLSGLGHTIWGQPIDLLGALLRCTLIHHAESRQAPSLHSFRFQKFMKFSDQWVQLACSSWAFNTTYTA